ncbi:hypothetical protein [Sphingobacterium paucimobilis]|uniref:Uncharacterized protein n=1 Tax=Sphingobacterium paucimobilis HER1398 TaxID=1346330 RepID=U2J5J8_9SPHI|nr:hypothetical protein [Sphingobacterium paucimobilis]ERJ57938.1 hypothetical protein M472_04080 [Sphingobacterium paucimobilis HER1398]
MRATKNNWLHAILFSILGLTLSFGVKAISNSNDILSVSKTANTEFRYKGSDTSINSITNPSNWETSDGTEECDFGELPCVVAPNMPSITNETQLTNYLNTLSPSAAVAFVEDNATKHRD